MDLSHGANFLSMVRGIEPEEYEVRIMDTCLVLHAEHEFNASTFTARVVASTMSTCYCSISAAMGALHGSLHGGANEKVLDMMEEFLRELSEKKGNWRSYEILKEIEAQFRARMEEKGKPIYPNVDFFSGAVYSLLGIPKILFTPVFAMARVSGWLAHILEQRKDNRIYRPESLYRGPGERPFVRLAERAG